MNLPARLVPSPARRNLYLAVCLALGTIPLALPSMAVAQQQVQAYDIAGGPLGEVLGRYAQASGAPISFQSSQVAGLTSQGVKGNYGVAEGFAQVLRGTGLVATPTTDGFQLEPQPEAGGALELGATTIMGQGMGEATENTGSYTTGLVSVGSKTPTSLRNTPQSVSIISSQLIQDQRMVTLTDAMRRVPGITTKHTNYRLPKFASRGFGIDNVQIDGASPMDIGSGLGTFYGNKVFDLAEFDHIEVLRGSSGLLGGTGDPGGIINLVRKRPLAEYQLNFNASAGTWDNYRSEVDVTGPLGFDGGLRGRAVVAYTDRQYFMDHRSTEQPFFYGILEADAGADTVLTLGGSYGKTHENGTGDGLPRYSTGGDLHLPRSTWYTDNHAYMDGYTQEVFAKIDHYFDEDWKFNGSYTYSYDYSDTEGLIPYGSVDETTNNGPYWWGSYVSQWSKQSVFDLNLSGKFDAFGRRHELLLGSDYQRVTSRWRAANGFLRKGGLIDLWNPGATPLPSYESDHNYWRDYSPNTREQYGLYSTLRLQLTDPLTLVVGARAQRYHYEQDYRTRSGNTWTYRSQINYREPTTLVPFGGVIYALDDQWSAYASYAEVFKPQAQKLKGPENASTAVEPMTGKTWETGLKGELFDGALNLSAALFYTQRENEAMSDPAYPRAPASYSGSCCFIGQGKVTSKGIDLEATGELMPGLEIIAGYTLNLTDNQTEDSGYTSITPKHLAKLWSVYTLPGDLSAWRVGAGVTAQSANYVSGTAYQFDSVGNAINSEPYDFVQGGYATYDAMVEYQVNDHWSVTVNGNNLFDRRYYETVGTSEYGNYYGEPRNYMLTVRGSFW